MSPVITARNDGANIEMSIDADRFVLQSGEAVVPADVMVVGFLTLILNAAPKVVTYDTIYARLLEPRDIALPPNDPREYIRKLKLRASRVIADLTGSDDAIEAVRGVGYRLVQGWSVVSQTPDLEPEIRLLAQILAAAAQLMLQTPLVEDEDGQRTLQVVDTQDVATLLTGYDECATAIWRRLEGQTPAPYRLQQLLLELRSYVALARSGRVDEETWRHLFVKELQERFNELQEIAGR